MIHQNSVVLVSYDFIFLFLPSSLKPCICRNILNTSSTFWTPHPFCFLNFVCIESCTFQSFCYTICQYKMNCTYIAKQLQMWSCQEPSVGLTTDKFLANLLSNTFTSKFNHWKFGVLNMFVLFEVVVILLFVNCSNALNRKQKLFLYLHNDYRRNVQPQAANMQKLVRRYILLECHKRIQKRSCKLQKMCSGTFPYWVFLIAHI